VSSNAAQAQHSCSQSGGISQRVVMFFSEAFECYGKLFLPPGFSASSKAGAVVLAPGMGETAASVEHTAGKLAAAGIVAMAIDYRGWGKSGAFIYMAEPIRWDDRLRFSQHTARVRLRRQRLVPEAQITDIRNAITFLQGEPGVDRTRVGVWGAGLGASHAIAVASMDARPRAVVAQNAELAGHGSTRAAYAPTPAEQADMIKLARSGQASVSAATAGTMQDPETRIALAQYKPFLMVDSIPAATAVLLLVGEKDGKPAIDAANAAAALLKGPSGVTAIPGAARMSTGAARDAAAQAAADWFSKHL
jgi:alpha-beta hydrolase superfamily lysophospholipase